MFFATILFAALANAAPTNKRDITCSFPNDDGLVAVTPDQGNAGWAISPDQRCSAGSYCPYACPPGQVSAQWDPAATTYNAKTSMHGGLFCNANGELSKPFPNRPLCVNGTGTVEVSNLADSNVAFCQTVLPGNEAMLIPTDVKGGKSRVLAVPDTDYYASSASHFYINSPGVSTDDGCVWGTKDEAKGNWAPYVAGANTDKNGNTFVKIGWNPKYLDDFTGLPDFGIRITCADGECNGAGCEIDPSKDGYNGISGASSDKSLGASYCVVTAENLNKATIEVFSV